MSTPTRRPLALVVDDDPILRTVGSEALEALGFAIEEAESGEDALRAVAERTPDFVLLDVNLPGRDGFAVCRAMRRKSELAEVPIVVVTGASEAEVIDRAFDSGATDFVHKPLDWQLIQHRVRFLMRANSAFKDLRDRQLELERTRELGGLGSWELNATTQEFGVSPELQLLLGLDDTSSSWQPFYAAIEREDRAAFEKLIRTVRETGQRGTLEHRVIVGESEVRHVEHTVELASAPTGERRFQGTVRDVTERRRAQDQVEFLEDFDSVTTLPNRNLLRRRLERLVERSDRGRGSIIVLCVGLDRFERVNRGLGLQAGDALLRAVATRLVESVRVTDFIGRASGPPEISRQGGDEFTIVIGGGELSGELNVAVNRILRVFQSPFDIDGRRVPVSASIGVSRYPEDGDSVDALLGSAAAAMVRAKKAGGGRYHFFDPGADRAAKNELAVESDFTRAIERNELFLEYQPVCDARDGSLVSVEALVRWNHPTRGRLGPMDFVPTVESSGQATALGNWVLREGCRQLREWDQQGLEGLSLNVNVSPQQFVGGDLGTFVQKILADTGFDPNRLEIELTETSLVGDGDEVETACQTLRTLGVGLALDDFGTGFSSLSHLIRFQIDTLKIDRSFVSRLEEGGTAAAVTAAVIAMARRLGITVVAEGVETDAQARFLKAERCERLQGYLLSRPLLPEQLLDWAQERSGEPTPKAD